MKHERQRGEPATGLLGDLRSALDRVTRPPLAGTVAALLFALLLVVVALHLASLTPPSGGRIETGTGDFLAFWTGAVTLHDGHGSALYDFAAQKKLQASILGGASPGFQGYLNPPLLAVLMVPLVPLGYLGAFYVYVAACAAALVLALAMLVKLLPTLGGSAATRWTLVFAIASYQPMLETTFGGQNTPITFALLVALALALRRGSTAASAVLLGLLTYKPQYALGAGIALAFSAQWPVVAGGAAVGIAHWLVGAWWSGPLWPVDMLALMSAYRPFEMAANGPTHFSWVTSAEVLMPSAIADAVAVAGIAAVLALLYRFRDLGRSADPAWLALVLCATMLASPHQQYYDVALLALPVALLVDQHVEHHSELGFAARVALAAAYVGYPAWELAFAIRVQPLFLVLLAVTAWALHAATEAELRQCQSP